MIKQILVKLTIFSFFILLFSCERNNVSPEPSESLLVEEFEQIEDFDQVSKALGELGENEIVLEIPEDFIKELQDNPEAQSRNNLTLYSCSNNGYSMTITAENISINLGPTGSGIFVNGNLMLTTTSPSSTRHYYSYHRAKLNYNSISGPLTSYSVPYTQYAGYQVGTTIRRNLLGTPFGYWYSSGTPLVFTFGGQIGFYADGQYRCVFNQSATTYSWN